MKKIIAILVSSCLCLSLGLNCFLSASASSITLGTDVTNELFSGTIPIYDEFRAVYDKSTETVKKLITIISDDFYHLFYTGGSSPNSKPNSTHRSVLDYYSSFTGSSFTIPICYDIAGKVYVKYTSGAPTELFTVDMHQINIRQYSGPTYVYFNDMSYITFRRYTADDMSLVSENTFYLGKDYTNSDSISNPTSLAPYAQWRCPYYYLSSFVNDSMPKSSSNYDRVNLEFRSNSVNNAEITMSTPPSYTWYKENLFRYFLVAGQTNNQTRYTEYVNAFGSTNYNFGGLTVNYWGDNFKAGDVVNSSNVNNYSYFTYDSTSNQLVFDSDKYLETVLPDLETKYYLNMDNYMTSLPSFDSPWNVEPLYNLLTMLLPSITDSDSGNGVPNEWLGVYPDYIIEYDADIDEPDIEWTPLETTTWFTDEVVYLFTETGLTPVVVGTFCLGLACLILI